MSQAREIAEQVDEVTADGSTFGAPAQMANHALRALRTPGSDWRRPPRPS